jgi:SAM-dependent methyltransferase
VKSTKRGEVASFADADQRLAEVLAKLETAEGYRAWLQELVDPSIRGRVLELGAGRGTFSPHFRSLGSSLTAIEPSAGACAHLRARLGDLADVEVIEGTLDDVGPSIFDSAVMLNVLEHIEDDIGIIKQIHSMLAPGSELAIWVPAFPILYGRFDRQVGHHRRYRRGTVSRLLEDAGFEVKICRYANLPGFFAWFVVVRILGWTPTSGRLSSFFDRFVVPITRRVERRLPPPFGQSLFAVARKPR